MSQRMPPKSNIFHTRGQMLLKMALEKRHTVSETPTCDLIESEVVLTRNTNLYSNTHIDVNSGEVSNNVSDPSKYFQMNRELPERQPRQISPIIQIIEPNLTESYDKPLGSPLDSTEEIDLIQLNHMQSSDDDNEQILNNSVLDDINLSDIIPSFDLKNDEHIESDVNKCPVMVPDDDRPSTPEIDRDDEVRDPDYVPDEDGTDSDSQKVTEPKRKMGPQNWSRESNKRLRMEGRAYKGMKKTDGHFTFSAEKDCRKVQERKCTEACDKRNRYCRDFTDDERQKIFTGFWENMDWNEKKIFLNGLVHRECVQERTVEKGDTDYRKKGSYKYFLKKDNQKLQVCKAMFLSTFCLGEKTVYAWIANIDDNGIPIKSTNSRRSTGDTIKADSAKEFLQNLPKLPSHYCRSSSSKNYLEPVFATGTELYRVYKNYCSENGKVCCGRKLFFEVFNELNMALFSPKKDRCDTCCSYEVKNLDDTTYREHIEAKDMARAEKDRDKQRAANDPSLVVLTMDLQALLLAPKLNASAQYYKTKLGCHNFTIYDIVSKYVQCYFWYESQGDLSASSFASCVEHYLQSRINERVQEIIIYSDGCTYQNRNSTMSNTLLMLSKKYGITITQKFLEHGHTQMECDSIHAVIERTIAKKPIYVPQNYVDKIREARVKPFPYKVEFLTHKFFKDYASLGYYTSVRPGSKVGDPVVTNLRVLQYSGSQIQYKTKYSDLFQDLPRRSKQRDPEPTDETQTLHLTAIPLKKKKFDHLQDLKPFIPKDYHDFYDNLPHE
ncbi:hypothetical protein SNE40_010529 [Patella caerulea]|uniref:Uncharacterized protein n=1 Tax=Patella caerulea TaxID=87958 RepID=A0AAN8Q0B7_PATCE